MSLFITDPLFKCFYRGAFKIPFTYAKMVTLLLWQMIPNKFASAQFQQQELSKLIKSNAEMMFVATLSLNALGSTKIQNKGHNQTQFPKYICT